MPSKEILFSSEAREKLFAGITKLNDAVKITLGSSGRNVIFGTRGRMPIITNDGVTITREVELKDEFENMGATMIRQAAEKTNDEAGDGTTTAIVLAHAIIKEGMNHIQKGANAVELKNGILEATQKIVAELEKIAIPITTKKQKQEIATVSAQSEEIGKIVADVLEKVGEKGIVTVEGGQTMGMEVEVVDGMRFINGLISPYYMVTNPQKMNAEIDDVKILMTDKVIGSFQEDLLPLYEKLQAEGVKQLVIIASDVSGNALKTVVVNRVNGAFDTFAIRMPSKTLLEDIAVITGGKVISEELGLKLKDTEISDLGTARKVIADKDSTTIVDGGGDKEEIKKLIKEIEENLKNLPEDKLYAEEKELKLRLAKLTGGVGVIKVGAATEVEQREKLHRVEDAVEATKAAIEEGIVAGGGAALVHATTIASLGINEKGGRSDDFRDGLGVVNNTAEAPLRQIARNAGLDGEKILKNLKDNTSFGFDINTGEQLDLVEAGIIDPKKVTRCALENAASVAGIFLTTECAIAEEPQKEEEAKK